MSSLFAGVLDKRKNGDDANSQMYSRIRIRRNVPSTTSTSFYRYFHRGIHGLSGPGSEKVTQTDYVVKTCPRSKVTAAPPSRRLSARQVSPFPIPPQLPLLPEVGWDALQPRGRRRVRRCFFCIAPFRFHSIHRHRRRHPNEVRNGRLSEGGRTRKTHASRTLLSCRHYVMRRKLGENRFSFLPHPKESILPLM